MKLALFTVILLGLMSCTDRQSNQSTEIKTGLKYAEGFHMKKDGPYTWLTVTYPYPGATSGYRYLLVPDGGTPPPHDAGVQVLRTPATTIVCTSTTHIPHLDYLGLTDKLTGFPTTDYITSTSMRERVDAGGVEELGIDKGMNLELLYTLKPSLVMGYTMTADLGQLKKIQELGIPVVINAEYLEKDPLGRAEWIKFTGALFGKEKEADSVFRSIENEYLKVKELAGKASERPDVLSGIVYGDAWFMPGGKNYAARLLDDAACNYLWSADSTHGWLELSFESVYEKAKDADIWIGVASFNSLEELAAAEKRYKMFRPYETGEVYTYNARVGAKGGNEFLELGYLRPDLVLKDLVRIAHPELLPEYQLYFHNKLD
jgi:iron complex transport system substrate-binding protein